MKNIDLNKIDNILSVVEKFIDDENADSAIADYFFGEVLYNMTIIDLTIKEHGGYVVAITWLCDRGFEKECNMYAYILNHYYFGEFDKMMNDLIDKEKYEKCASLQKYKNVNVLPIF